MNKSGLKKSGLNKSGLNNSPVLPGKTLGVLGSGQLGRMLAMAAKRMGYRVVIYSPDRNTPAGQVSDVEITAAYEDENTLRDFAAQVDVVTMEFENIPSAALETLAESVPVYPQPHILHTTQNRLREKNYLKANGFPVVPFEEIDSLNDLKNALQTIGTPSVLKTAGFGYDGKGQVLIKDAGEAENAFAKMNGAKAVLEKFIDLACEISVVGARGAQGEFVAFPPGENRHVNHILETTVVPANVAPALSQKALAIAEAVCESLDLRGVLCVEFFVTHQGEILINELAPRPHNSGHYTIEACPTSQFEQQLRAVCGLPLGDPWLIQPAAMLNLLGDLWLDGEPDWKSILEIPGMQLHLYGKTEPRPGRKMGHFTTLADTPEDALQKLQRAKTILKKQLVK